MKFRFQVGEEFDMLTQGELDESLARQLEIQKAAAGGIKFRRMPPLIGQASGGKLLLGGDSGQQAGQQFGPDSGWAWAIRLFTVSGLTSGATPDVVNLFIVGGMSGLGINWWQFNGNSFAYTFGKVDLVIRSGEYIGLQSVGSFAATGQITATANMVQCPEERLGELAD